jgi:hypothetical protein
LPGWIKPDSCALQNERVKGAVEESRSLQVLSSLGSPDGSVHFSPEDAGHFGKRIAAKPVD